jgi:hypothetical protein
MTGATFQDLNYSIDGYSDTENFITIHGINSDYMLKTSIFNSKRK